MSQVRLVQFRFKPGKKQIWLDWCEQLKQRVDEGMKTLKGERVLSESLLSLARWRFHILLYGG